MDCQQFSLHQILHRKEDELKRLQDAITCAQDECQYLKKEGTKEAYGGRAVLGPANKEIWEQRWEAYPKWRQRHEEDKVLSQEGEVKRRIRELQKTGKWTDRAILGPSCEPRRNKTLWDYMLEELSQRQQSTAHEISWKQSMAKTCGRRVQQWHKARESAEQKKAKDEEEHLRKIAKTMARGVKKYWDEVEKIVEDKHKMIHDEKHNRLLMRKQQQIIANAEELTTELRADLEGDQASEASSSSSLATFSSDEEDNEETLEQEERLAQEEGETYEGELDDLKRIAEMDLDELRAKLAAMEENDAEEEVEPEDGMLAHATKKKEAKAIQNGKTMDEKTMNDIIADLNKSQPGGVDLSTAKVKVKLPFLMNPQYTLREYQLIGLDWLNTMYNKNLNGILADEMGLGKTVMAIAMLANLACTRDIWGPHLIVVPTSVLLNWEIEFKRFCPSFKVLTYHGSRQYRNSLRKGWNTENRFHVCITSYNLILSDATVFRRKKWEYMILDEAQYIKNWKSKKWETLLNFNTERRLLLTGTPLQNNLMEMWSLLHFLMPDAVAFESNQEFREWFSNPMNDMVTGQSEINEQLIHRLHSLLRPFILRRLKKDVEKQLPKKYHHVLSCKLSKRQRILYDDFMNLATTKDTISQGSYTGLIGILMSLRKVCNHPDLFEERPITSPFDQLDPIDLRIPRHACKPMEDMEDRMRTFQWLCTELLDTWSISTIQERAVKAPEILETMRLQPHEDVARLHPTHVFGAYSTDLYAKKVRLQEERAALIAHTNMARCMMCSLGMSANLVRTVKTLADLRSSPHLSLQYASDHFEPCGSGIMRQMVMTPEQRMLSNMELLKEYTCCIPAARARPPTLSAYLPIHYRPQKFRALRMEDIPYFDFDLLAPYREPFVRMQMSFPDKYLMQYDCGKLQVLSRLLVKLKADGSRALIFTQMSKMLDILESFLCMHGYTYLRLDGSTKLEDRQFLMERFNHDDRLFVFILSTRSGGIGINLTGANCVIFYDSDWNPAMDLQAQDRCHRIGQTRDVHIYRLISEHTIEENIYKKVQEKKMIVNVTLKGGKFGADFSDNKVNVRDFFHSFDEDMDVDEIRRLQIMAGEDIEETVPHCKQNGISVVAKDPAIKIEGATEVLTEELPLLPDSVQLEVDNEVETAMIKAEDEDDRIAYKKAKEETSKELKEFDENYEFKDIEQVDVEVLEEEFASKLKPLVRRSVEVFADLYPDRVAEIAEEYEVEEYEQLIIGTVGTDGACVQLGAPKACSPMSVSSTPGPDSPAGSLPCMDGQPGDLVPIPPSSSDGPEDANALPTQPRGQKRSGNLPQPRSKRVRTLHPNEQGEEPEGGSFSPVEDLPPPRFACVVTHSYPSGLHVLAKIPVPCPKVRNVGTRLTPQRDLAPISEDEETALFYETEHVDNVLAQYCGIQFDLDDSDIEHFYNHCQEKDQKRLERERELREYLPSGSDGGSEASIKEVQRAQGLERARALASPAPGVETRPVRRTLKPIAGTFDGEAEDVDDQDTAIVESSGEGPPKRRPQSRGYRAGEPISPAARRRREEECPSSSSLREDSEMPWKEWEEAALLKAVEKLGPIVPRQVFPLGECSFVPPTTRSSSLAASSHHWNWDLLCDVVNTVGFPSAAPRFAAQCKSRHAHLMTGQAPPPRQRNRLHGQPLDIIQKDTKKRNLQWVLSLIPPPPTKLIKAPKRKKAAEVASYPDGSESTCCTTRPSSSVPQNRVELKGHTPSELLRIIAEKQRPSGPESHASPPPPHSSQLHPQRQAKVPSQPGVTYPPPTASYAYTAGPGGGAGRTGPPLAGIVGMQAVPVSLPTSPETPMAPKETPPKGGLSGGPQWELQPAPPGASIPYHVPSPSPESSPLMPAVPSAHHLQTMAFSPHPSTQHTAGMPPTTSPHPPHPSTLTQPPQRPIHHIYLPGDAATRITTNSTNPLGHLPSPSSFGAAQGALGNPALGPGALGPTAPLGGPHAGFSGMGPLPPPTFALSPQIHASQATQPHHLMAAFSWAQAGMPPSQRQFQQLQQQFHQQQRLALSPQMPPPPGHLGSDMPGYPGIGTGASYM